MFKKRFIQILTICFQVGLLVAMFIPIMQENSNNVTIWNKIVEDFKSGNSELILIDSLYYIPNIITIILVAIFKTKIKYLLAAVASSFGVSILLIQYIFPAVATPYLFYTYSLGFYAIPALQFLIIIFCILGISLDEIKGENPILTDRQAKENTQEILLDDEHE